MENENRFETKLIEGSVFKKQYYIIVDKETGVNYLFVKDGYGAGLTALLDSNGNPVIDKENKNEKEII